MHDARARVRERSKRVHTYIDRQTHIFAGALSRIRPVPDPGDFLGFLRRNETSFLTPPATERRASSRHVRSVRFLEVVHKVHLVLRCLLCRLVVARLRRSRSWAHSSFAALISRSHRDRLCLLHATLEGRVSLVSCQVQELLLLGHGHRGICIVELLAANQ